MCTFVTTLISGLHACADVIQSDSPSTAGRSANAAACHSLAEAVVSYVNVGDVAAEPEGNAGCSWTTTQGFYSIAPATGFRVSVSDR